MSRAYRYRTTGQGTPWIVAPDRNRIRDTGARLERMRPAGEPPLWVGVLILLVIGAAVWFAIIAFSSPPAAGPDAYAPASRGTPPSSAVGPDAANRGQGR